MKLVALLLSLALAAPAAAFNRLIPPAGAPGFCAVTPRPELGIPDRSLVVCRWPVGDYTGDGVAEVAELTLLLNRQGGPDCSRSKYSILDVTRSRHQALLIAGAC